MPLPVVYGLLLPFMGTSLGAACVFLLRGELKVGVQKGFAGFAAGVMVAASIWSLLIPAMDQSASMGKLAFIPAALGYGAGTLFLLLLDHVIPHLHLHAEEQEGPKVALDRTIMMVLAVTLHNIPEGMAVGIVLAGWMYGQANITISAALILALGIAIQNFPEGAIISLPLRAQGESRGKAFVNGLLSGAVEPLAGILTIMGAGFIIPILPFLLSFAAGAMLYVVVEELIPEMAEGEHSNIGSICFSLGFVLMMVLDVALS